jgi:hypothetical protein
MCSDNWTITNSFRAAYVAWDDVNIFQANRASKKHQSDRYFDDDNSLDEFYDLTLGLNSNFKTGKSSSFIRSGYGRSHHRFF